MKIFEYGLLMGDIEKASGKIGERPERDSEARRHDAVRNDKNDRR
jgi:hypothetical protein